MVKHLAFVKFGGIIISFFCTMVNIFHIFSHFIFHVHFFFFINFFFSKVFFVIRLIAAPNSNALLPIVDTDPLMACDLMDGRDAFLTLARDKHLEFSSMRRSKWSTMCMLVELHNQSQDRFVYTCNVCKHHVETRFHCTVCEVRTIEWEEWGDSNDLRCDLMPFLFVVCVKLIWHEKITSFSQDTLNFLHYPELLKTCARKSSVWSPQLYK